MGRSVLDGTCVLFVCFCLRMSASCEAQGSSIVYIYRLAGLDGHGGNVV